MSEIERYDCEEERSCEYEVKAVMQVDPTGYYVRHADHLVYLNEMRMDRDVERLRADTAEAESKTMKEDVGEFVKEQLCMPGQRPGETFVGQSLRMLKTAKRLAEQFGFDSATFGTSEDIQTLTDFDAMEKKLAAAEQRIERMSEVLQLLRVCASTSPDFKRSIDAALNPNPEAESHES